MNCSATVDSGFSSLPGQTKLLEEIMRKKCIRAAVLFVVISSSWPTGLGAQTNPSLEDLVAIWATGSFRSPLMCEFDGKLVRGVRRVVVRSRPMPNRAPEVSMEFIDIQAGEATRCLDATGVPVPNLIGKLELKRTGGHPHPETAKRDFKRALRQDKGFTYQIRTGVLAVASIESPPTEPEMRDFEGGTATLSLIYPATDAARALGEFQSGRKLLLLLKSRDERKIVLPLFDPSSPPE